MAKEKIAPQCILGNLGNCPPKCALYENSREITDLLGANFDPQESRRKIVFADATDPSINVARIARVMAMCSKESISNHGINN